MLNIGIVGRFKTGSHCVSQVSGEVGGGAQSRALSAEMETVQKFVQISTASPPMFAVLFSCALIYMADTTTIQMARIEPTTSFNKYDDTC
jgi:hypothetical protein